MKPILNIENLTKIYGNVPSQTKALNGITFQVMPGEFLGIMGSSGSGKSTLLKWYATEIYKANGYDIALVQRLLQHSSAATTQRYIGIEPQRIEKAIEQHARLI